MPITNLNRKLTSDEQQKLIMLVDELKRRGKPVDLNRIMSFTNITKNEKFHRDDSGFFVKGDGKRYNPTEAQKGFYLSQARFVSYWGSRGSGKSSGGAQGSE